jgi:hypothetical protein
VISITDDFCGGAILNIDAVSVLDVVFMLGVVARFVCVYIARRSHGNPKLLYRNCESRRIFCRQPGAQLTPYILMTGKLVDAMERLAVEGKVDMLKTSHGSCRRRRDGNHLRSLRLGLGFFPYDLVHSFFCLLS